MNPRVYVAWLLVLILCFTGCREEQAPTGDTQSASGPVKKESVEAIKARYAGTELKVLDISERQWQGKNALAVTLSAPLDAKTPLHQYLSVSIPGKGLADGAWVLSEDGRVLYFAQTEPQTTYDISVFNGLPALTGTTLAEPIQGSVTTRDVQPAVSFASNGSVLPLRLTSGLPVSVINVNEVEINFHRIHPEKIHQFLQAAENNYGERFYNYESLRHWGTLAYSGRFSLNPPKNTLTKMAIAVEDIIELQAPGLYVAVMDEPGTYDYQRQMTYFTVTDIGLHARKYARQLVIEAASLQSALPLAGVRLSLHKSDGTLIQEQKTSPQGEAIFNNLSDNIAYLLAYKDQQVSLLDFTGPALDLSAFDLGRRPVHPQELFMYTPRDLFRPGETVDLHALLRGPDGEPVPAQTLNTRLIRPDGLVAQESLLQAQALNYYHQRFTLPTNAPTGLWRFEVNNLQGGDQQLYFHVEDFLPERMTLSFNHDSLTPLQFGTGESIAVAVEGRYLYGAPAAGNRLSTQASLSLQRQPHQTLAGFYFGNEFETLPDALSVEDIVLDDAGIGQISLEPTWSHIQSPMSLQLVASLYESGGRPVTRAYQASLWPDQPQYGIRPSFGDKNPEAQSLVSFDLVRAAADGSLLPAEQAEIRLIREDRQYYWKYNDNQGWHYEFTDKEFVVSSQITALQAHTDNRFSFPVDWGRYRLEVLDPGSSHKTTLRFHAGEDWYAHWQESQSTQRSIRPDIVTLALDKAAYNGGDTATLQINSPHAGQAMVLVESDKLLWSQQLSLLQPQSRIEIPVSKDWHRHDTYISVVVLRPAASLTTSNQLQTPKRAFGLIHLPLNREARRLNLALTAPEKVLPESELVATLEVKTATGEVPSEAYVTLAAVDVGVLNISRFETPDPFDAFFGQRRYQSDSYDLYSRLIELHQDTKARLRFGGDVDLSRGGEMPESDVQIVSLNPSVVKLDSQGKARIALPLPYFNGKLRLMALAFGSDSYASAEAETTVAAPLVSQINLPRFMAMGDQSSGVLDVHNLSGGPLDLNVQIRTGAALTETESHQRLQLANEAKTRIPFALHADQLATGTVSVALSAPGMANIERQWRLGVRPAYPAELRQWHGSLLSPDTTAEDNATTPPSLKIPAGLADGLHPGSVEALLTLTNRVDLNVNTQLKHLLRYPYGCLEQTSSTAYPYAYSTQEVQKQFDMPLLSDSERAERVAAALTRIAGMQKANGGYGLWDANSDEEHWLTAYVADFMLNLREQGFVVPSQLLDSTLGRLKEYVNRPGSQFEQRYSDNMNHYRLAYRSYAAYVLARVNQVSLSSLRTLHDRQRKDAETRLPLVHLGLALILAGDDARGQVALNEALALKHPVNRYLGDYGSDIRDEAMTVYLLLKHRQRQSDIYRHAMSLAGEVQSRRWLSTQERNALFLAGVMLESNSKHPWSAELTLGDAPAQTLKQAAAYLRKLGSEPLAAGGQITLTGAGPLFASLQAVGYPLTKPTPVADGYHILRTYFDATGKPLDGLTQVRSGDLVLVGLQIGQDRRAPDTLVIDMIPAGFELENPNLPDGVKTDLISVDGTLIPELQRNTLIKHQEYRDDRYVAAIDAQWGQQRLFYLMRAVTPGTYRVPPPYVEDMYRPEYRAIGDAPEQVVVVPR